MPKHSIQPISPKRVDVEALLTAADHLMNSRYPAEVNHLDGAEELARPHVLVLGVFIDKALAGIAAAKRFDGIHPYGELKRLFIKPEHRGKNLSTALIEALESHLRQHQIPLACLETGNKQLEAIGLFKKLGYVECEPFGTYRENPHSVFLQKHLEGRCAE